MLSLISVEIMFIAAIAGQIYGGGADGAIAAGVLTLFWLLWNCMLYFNWRHVKAAIAIIDASAAFLDDTKRIVLVQLVYFVLKIIVIALWSIGQAYVFSLGNIQPDVTDPNP